MDSPTKYEPISGNEITEHRMEEFELHSGDPSRSPTVVSETTDKSHLLAPYQTNKGLTMLTAAIFLAGELAGTGVLTMPSAMARTGFYGIILICITLALAIYSGILLGKTWEVAKLTRDTDDPMQDPYPYIGEVAYGKVGRNVVSILLQVNIVLISLVFLTLTTEIISNLLTFHIANIPVKEEFRVWLVLCSVILIPFTWLGTPKDFWGVGLAALVSTFVGALLILIKLGFVIAKEGTGPTNTKPSVVPFFSGFGTFIFAFTGISLFPTVQTDMKDPSKFSYSVVLGYFLVVVLYLPVAIIGYVALGVNAQSSILQNLSMFDIKHHTKRVLVSMADVLFASHLLFAFIMYLNPLVQLIESYFRITAFSWRRCCLRTGAVIAILGLAEIFPRFGPVIDLVGGFLNTVLCFIFPMLFYYKLHCPLHNLHKFVMGVALLVSICGCVVATYSAIINIQIAFRDIYSH